MIVIAVVIFIVLCAVGVLVGYMIRELRRTAKAQSIAADEAVAKGTYQIFQWLKNGILKWYIERKKWIYSSGNSKFLCHEQLYRRPTMLKKKQTKKMRGGREDRRSFL